jgi:hypothetical protein
VFEGLDFLIVKNKAINVQAVAMIKATSNRRPERQRADK